MKESYQSWSTLLFIKKETVVILNKYTFVPSVFMTKVHPPPPQAPRPTLVIWQYTGIFTDPTFSMWALFSLPLIRIAQLQYIKLLTWLRDLGEYNKRIISRMHLSMSSRWGRRGGRQGIRRDFDRSLWPGGRTFELSHCPEGWDISIFVRARDHKSFPGVGNFSYFDLTFLPRVGNFTAIIWKMSKSRPPPTHRLDIDRCIISFGLFP